MTENQNGNGMVMPVAPMYGGYGNNGFGGLFGGDGAWLILFLFAAMWGGFGGGWGGNFGGFGGFEGGAFPWLLASNTNTDNIVTSGFNQAATNAALSGIQSSITSGFGDVQTALCGGFAGINSNISNGFAQAEIANNARQIADMQQNFALQQQFSNCCCENRLGIANLSADIARENCADRAALSDGLRDLIVSNNANTQRILDQLCQDKIDSKNDTISQLRQELLYARGQASQDVQTARILAGQTSEVDALYNRLNNCPVNTVPVYGRQPVFTCGNNGCGCN